MVISKVVLVKVVRGLLLVNHIVYRNKYIVNNNIVKGILVYSRKECIYHK